MLRRVVYVLWLFQISFSVHYRKGLNTERNIFGILLNRNHIIFTIFWLIWNQAEFDLVPNQLENGKNNMILVWLNKIWKWFLCRCLLSFASPRHNTYSGVICFVSITDVLTCLYLQTLTSYFRVKLCHWRIVSRNLHLVSNRFGVKKCSSLVA